MAGDYADVKYVRAILARVFAAEESSARPKLRPQAFTRTLYSQYVALPAASGPVSGVFDKAKASGLSWIRAATGVSAFAPLSWERHADATTVFRELVLALNTGRRLVAVAEDDRPSQVIDGDPPMVVLSHRAVDTWQNAHLRFQLARLLELTRRRFVVATELDELGLASALSALVSQLTPQAQIPKLSVVDRDTFHRVTEFVSRLRSQGAFDVLDELAALLEGMETGEGGLVAAADEYVVSAHATATRVGLLCSGSLRATLECILSADGVVPRVLESASEAAEYVVDDEAAQALLAYRLTPACYEASLALGLRLPAVQESVEVDDVHRVPVLPPARPRRGPSTRVEDEEPDDDGIDVDLTGLDAQPAQPGVGEAELVEPAAEPDAELEAEPEAAPVEPLEAEPEAAPVEPLEGEPAAEPAAEPEAEPEGAPVEPLEDEPQAAEPQAPPPTAKPETAVYAAEPGAELDAADLEAPSRPEPRPPAEATPALRRALHVVDFSEENEPAEEPTGLWVPELGGAGLPPLTAEDIGPGSAEGVHASGTDGTLPEPTEPVRDPALADTTTLAAVTPEPAKRDKPSDEGRPSDRAPILSLVSQVVVVGQPPAETATHRQRDTDQHVFVPESEATPWDVRANQGGLPELAKLADAAESTSIDPAFPEVPDLYSGPDKWEEPSQPKDAAAVAVGPALPVLDLAGTFDSQAGFASSSEVPAVESSDAAPHQTQRNPQVGPGMLFSKEFMPGELLSEIYCVEKAFATGGFAVLYHGTRMTDNAPVVIKCPREQVLTGDPVAVKRFEREARAAMSMRHPNVVRTLAFGRHGNDTPYIVMERLDGVPLTKIMSAGPVTLADSVPVLVQILAALQALHTRGLVHRDLSPANVFACVKEDGTIGPPYEIKLLDFGLVKSLRSRSRADGEELTFAGQLVGTPGYIAPETIRGEDVTPAADIYSVGIMGHEMLVGESAFKGSRGDRVAAQGRGELPPVPLSYAESPVYRVIRQMMSVDPRRRFVSCQVAQMALERAWEKTR